jgi:hypothetical protein
VVLVPPVAPLGRTVAGGGSARFVLRYVSVAEESVPKRPISAMTIAESSGS